MFDRSASSEFRMVPPAPLPAPSQRERYMPKEVIRRLLHLKILLLVATLLWFGGVAETAQDHDESWWQIVPGERVGRITRNISEEEIIEIFGAKNVLSTDVGVGEGETIPGTVVYPDDPTKTLEILWKSGGQRNTPSEVRIRGKSSRWRTKNGLSLGSTLREIERLNGRPFRLTGFGWDYSGTVIDCNQGRLTELGCVNPEDRSRTIRGRKLLLRLIPHEGERTSREYRAVLGDRDFSSGDPAMQKLNPRVYEMIIFFAP